MYRVKCAVVTEMENSRKNFTQPFNTFIYTILIFTLATQCIASLLRLICSFQRYKEFKTYDVGGKPRLLSWCLITHNMNVNTLPQRFDRKTKRAGDFTQGQPLPSSPANCKSLSIWASAKCLKCKCPHHGGWTWCQACGVLSVCRPRQRWSGIGREQMGDGADPSDEPLREVHWLH